MSREQESESRTAAMQRILDDRAAKRLAKEEAEKARWKKYHEQLAKGDSNSGGGARRSRFGARPFRWGG